MIQEYIDETASSWGMQILQNFDDYCGKFWLVKPKAADLNKLLDTLMKAA
jgi:glutamate synthase (NADPH/NADH) large chain